MLYHAYSDKDLVLLMSKDDELAFRALYDRYWKKLLAQALIKLRSQEESEEIVQTVFVNLWRRRHSLQLKFSFHTYIASMLKYEVLRQLKQQQKEKLLKGRTAAFQSEEDHATLHWLDFGQLREQLEKTIQLLPEKCQLVFRLSREAGFSEKQIAESLNIAPKTVQSHMGKALKHLRASLQSLF